MSKKFLAGSYLMKYEYMMQILPTKPIEPDKRARNQYLAFLKQYMREYGYTDIIPNVDKIARKMMFEEFVFINEYHRGTFMRMYCKRTRAYTNSDKVKTAAIYLLSTDKVFRTVLENYIANPLYTLPITVKGITDEQQQNTYQAVKYVLGIGKGITDEDISDSEIMSDMVRCLLINAKLIAKYGLHGYLDKNTTKPVERYINNSQISRCR